MICITHATHAPAKHCWRSAHLLVAVDARLTCWSLLTLGSSARRCWRSAHLLVAADALQEGATWEDIENMYMMSMAQQGGRGVYLMCGVGELPGGVVRKNEPLFLDALGQYSHYHGDFGRCAVVGEPDAEHRRRHA